LNPLLSGGFENVMQLGEEVGWADLERLSDIDEFDDTQAALAALIFGDEGLSSAETPGELALGHASVFALPEKQVAQLDLTRRTQSVAHGRGQPELNVASGNNPVSGLSHFGIFE
jgi:hypothetical protein